MSADPIPKRIFVGNFDFETSESELLVAFQVCGRVADVNIIRKSLSDFYGFVTFASSEAAEEALDGRFDFYIRGRRLRVRRAYLKSPKSLLIQGFGVPFTPDVDTTTPSVSLASINDVLAAFGRQFCIATPAPVSHHYLGCIEVKQSMRTLQFDMRTQATKEAIWRILTATGRSHQIGSGRKKTPKEVSRILGDRPNLQFSLSLINLTISTASLTLVVTDTGQFIANHQMQSISFASGGDPDTLDYVAYVAKDPINNRACHVLECNEGLAQDVINTIGQAFELRFKEYLKNPPKAVTPPDRTEPLFHDGKSRWGDDEPEYYNEIPGKRPPEAGLVDKRIEATAISSNHSHQMLMTGTSGEAPSYVNRQIKQRSFDDHNYINTSLLHQNEAPATIVYDQKSPNLPLSGSAAPVQRLSQGSNLMDLNTPPISPQKGGGGGGGGGGALAIAAAIGISCDDNAPRHGSNSSVDAFDMKPFEKALHVDKSSAVGALQHEPWFHGKVSRQDAESYLKEDGDFLVRESGTTPGQFVLSGLHDGLRKHLLLVDPYGVVRTKDRQFDSVCHLISFHRNNNLPIVSSGSMLMLQQPVTRKIER